jgi:hypothetical protein
MHVYGPLTPFPIDVLNGDFLYIYRKSPVVEDALKVHQFFWPKKKYLKFYLGSRRIAIISVDNKMNFNTMTVQTEFPNWKNGNSLSQYLPIK